MSLIHLLSVLLSLYIAHAAPSEITLHNKDSVTVPNAVRNWTLICEDLCSLKISGPACGLDCQKIPVNENLFEKIKDVSTEAHAELCQNLCKIELGNNKCECKVSIVPASSPITLAVYRQDRFKICSDTCRFYHVTLKGCSQCPFEEHQELLFQRFQHHHNPVRSIGFISQSHPSISQTSITHSAVPNNLKPVPQNGIPFNHPQTTTGSSTPDWNKVCAQLCRNGTGGLLCNCDLPPF